MNQHQAPPDVIEAGSGRSLTRYEEAGPPTASRRHPEPGALVALPTVATVDEAADDYGMTGELRAPFYPYNGKRGKFVHPLTGELTDYTRLVLLRRLSDSRIFWNPDMKAAEGEKILCASDDTVVAREARDEEAQVRREALGITGICDTCPMRQFGRDKYGKPTKPPCSFYVNLAVAEADDEEPIPYHLGIKSTGLKAIMPVLDRWRLLRIAKAVKGIPGFALVFELYADGEEGVPPLTYFPLHARINGKDLAPKENWPGLAALQRAIRGLPIDVTSQIIESDERAPEDEAVEATYAYGPDYDPDYGDEPHVESAEEFTARMEAEEADARRAAADAPTAPPAGPKPAGAAQPTPAAPEPATASSAPEPAAGTLPGMEPARPRKAGRT